MSYKYKVLPHPADIKLEITASCKEDIFKGALEGMAYIIQPNASRKSVLKKEQIEIHSLDINALLVDFLSEVLAKSDIYNCIFDKVKIEKLTDNFIKGRLEGKNVERFSKEIKAVTYHQLNINQDKNGDWKAIILFDI
ncbi:MAG: archease [Candidatus Pacebacteria bacterium]|nr:archease [Candidatus Paceibacterota bacterium]